MANFKTPDLNAPRYRRKVYNTVSPEFIKLLKQKVHACENYTDAELRNIINTYNENIYKTVIEIRDGIELQSQLGHLFIGSCPKSRKRSNVDMKTSAEYAEKVKHRNFESDQHIAKIFYTVYADKYRFKNHELWAFNGSRYFTRAVSHAYPENWKKYIEIDPLKKVSMIFKSSMNKMKNARKNSSALEEYNEFDF